MVDIQTISIVIAAAGVLIGVVYYILDMRHQNKVRQTDLVMRLYETFGSDDFQRAGREVSEIAYQDYDDFVKKYGEPGSEEPIPVAITKLHYFFEEVGVLLSRKLVDIDLIDQLMGFNIMIIGSKTMPILEEARKRANLPRIRANFEYLYNEMKKREQKLQKGALIG
jgi:hypothetical protein